MSESTSPRYAGSQEEGAAPAVFKWTFLIALVFIQFFVYGIDLFSWMYYGFSMWRSFSAISGLDPIQSVLKSHTTFVRNYFDVLTAPVYERPVLFILTSALVRLTQMALCYEIFLRVCKQWRPTMLAVAVFAFSFGIFGWPQNGLIASPILLAASVSVILSLAGTLQLMKERWLPASLLLGLACHVHAFYGLSILPPIVVGLFLHSWRFPSRQAFIRAVLFVIGASAVVWPLALVGDASRISQTLLSTNHWFLFLMMRDPDDVSILYSISQFGLAVAAAASFYRHLKQDKSWQPGSIDHDLVESVLYGSLLFVSLCIIVEMAQVKGIFLGPLSDLLIAVQFRRGLWLIALTVIPLTLRALARRDPEIALTLPGHILLCLWPFMIEFQSVILPMGFIGLLLLTVFASSDRKRPLWIGLMAASFLICFFPYFPGITISEPRDKVSALFLTAGIGGGFLYWRFPAITKLGWEARILPCILLAPLLVGAKDLWRGRGLIPDLRAIEKKIDGKLSYDDLMMITIQRSRVVTGEDGAAEYKFADEAELLAYKDALIGLQKRKQSIGPLLSNPVFRLDSRQYVELPIVLSEFQDRALSMFSRSFAANYDYRLNKIFGKGIMWFYQDEGYQARFRQAFYELEPGRLRALGKEGVIRFLVSNREYSQLNSVYRNQRFRVYDLALP